MFLNGFFSIVFAVSNALPHHHYYPSEESNDIGDSYEYGNSRSYPSGSFSGESYDGGLMDSGSYGRGTQDSGSHDTYPSQDDNYIGDSYKYGDNYEDDDAPYYDGSYDSGSYGVGSDDGGSYDGSNSGVSHGDGTQDTGPHDTYPSAVTPEVDGAHHPATEPEVAVAQRYKRQASYAASGLAGSHDDRNGVPRKPGKLHGRFDLNGSGNNAKNYNLNGGIGAGSVLWRSNNNRHSLGAGAYVGQSRGRFHGHRYKSKPDIGVGLGYKFKF